MISTTRIYDELVRCLNIRYTLIELYLDSTLRGVANRIYSSIKDIMTLYALEKALYNALYYGYTETEIETLIFKIREYTLALGFRSNVSYFDFKYPTIECEDATNETYKGGDIVINNYITKSVTINEGNTITYEGDTITNNISSGSSWRSKDLIITVDGQTEIPDIGFNIANVDVDTIRLEVQGDDSVYSTTGYGYHIVGTTLHWHHFYDLKVGMQIAIKWREDETIS